LVRTGASVDVFEGVTKVVEESAAYPGTADV
jgi:hypothetical protein